MKVKLDENLPDVLADLIRGFGHDVQTALEEGLQGQSDDALWCAALSESRFLITQDLDFSDLRKFAPGTHAGILLIRLYTPSRRNLITTIEEVFGSASIEAWQGCFVVVTARKTRVIKPGGATQRGG
jgi:predicted nuclease of predicted toxin-antitoxin system